MRYYHELPKGTVSLALEVKDGLVAVDAYDASGRAIGRLPHDSSSAEFRATLERYFAKESFPFGGDPVIAIVQNPMAVRIINR